MNTYLETDVVVSPYGSWMYIYIYAVSAYHH